MSKKHIILYSSLTISLLCYILLAFYTERNQYERLFSIVTVLFGCYWLIYKYGPTIKSLRFWFQTAIIFRCVFLFSTPTLSDDYFRFVWDGYIQTEGINPFLNTPIKAARELPLESFQNTLLTEMNSLEYYSVYPPILQVAFASTSYLSGYSIQVNVMLLKFIILIFEGITLFLLFRLINYLKQPPERWLLYAFNPLIIVELVGNIHFEGIMITGLVATFYFLASNRNNWAALSFVIAVGVKLLPLVILPLIWRKLGFKKGFIFSSFIGIGLILMFLPYLSIDVIHNISQSINLYFQTFEFNASIYYLFRWIGIQWSGYNMIDTIGIINALITMTLILLVSFRKPKDWQVMIKYSLVIFSVYCFFSSIVHPWYITTIVMLAILAKYNFGLLWSGLIFLSYFTYKDDTYTENMWFVILEYGLVYGYIVFEYMQQKSKPSTSVL